MKLQILKCFKLFLMVLFCAGSLSAAERVPAIQALTNHSDVIAIGKIVDVRYQMDQNDIWTVGAVLVEKSLKGSANGIIYFRIPGGQRNINGRILVTRVEGTPELSLMQRGIFFLNGQAPQFFQPVSWSRGCWKIQAKQGKEMVTPVSDDSDSEPSASLEDFVADVQRSIGR